MAETPKAGTVKVQPIRGSSKKSYCSTGLSAWPVAAGLACLFGSATARGRRALSDRRENNSLIWADYKCHKRRVNGSFRRRSWRNHGTKQKVRHPLAFHPRTVPDRLPRELTRGTLRVPLGEAQGSCALRARAEKAQARRFASSRKLRPSRPSFRAARSTRQTPGSFPT